MLEFLVKQKKPTWNETSLYAKICIKKKHISTAQAAFQINIVIKFLRCSLLNPACQSVCRRHVNTYNLPTVNVSHAFLFDYSDSAISFCLSPTKFFLHKIHFQILCSLYPTSNIFTCCPLCNSLPSIDVEFFI